MNWLSVMKFFWHLSEKHWLLYPFVWVGDWMEDYGLDHGYITFRKDLLERILKHESNP